MVARVVPAHPVADEDRMSLLGGHHRLDPGPGCRIRFGAFRILRRMSQIQSAARTRRDRGQQFASERRRGISHFDAEADNDRGPPIVAGLTRVKYQSRGGPRRVTEVPTTVSDVTRE